MRTVSIAGLSAILLGLGTEATAQFSSCPGGVCYPPEASMARSRVRVSSSTRAGTPRGGLFARLFGRRQAAYGAASAYGGASAYGSAYAAPPTFPAA